MTARPSTPRAREAGDTEVFTQAVDRQTGAIRAHGRLTVQGADLLRGTVLAMHGRGHHDVLVDLTGVPAADDDGLAELRSLEDSMAARGGRLVLVHAPAALG